MYTKLNYDLMPKATYCRPQIASFGLTEKQARDSGYEVRVGKFPMIANGKALALGDTEGIVKIVVDAGLDIMSHDHEKNSAKVLHIFNRSGLKQFMY